MTDWNAFMDQFADLIADKVAQRINSAQAWPVLETKEGIPASMTEVTSLDMEPEREEREPVEVKVTSHDYDARRVALGKIDVRTMRKQLSAAGGGDVEEFAHLKKNELIEKVIDFEQLIGRSIDEEIERLSDYPDDTDTSEPEPEEDDTEVELTRESALELDLPVLREIAVKNGVKGDLSGLDVEAVVDVIFGGEIPESKPADDADEEDEDLLTKEDVRGMSLAELKDLIPEIEAQGGVVEYDRLMDAPELADAIIKAIF